MPALWGTICQEGWEVFLLWVLSGAISGAKYIGGGGGLQPIHGHISYLFVTMQFPNSLSRSINPRAARRPYRYGEDVSYGR